MTVVAVDDFWTIVDGLRRAARQSVEKPAWMPFGACYGLDPDLFYPDRGESKKAKQAKEVCRTCPVMDLCLEHAILTNETMGVWGGKTAAQRAKMRRARRRAGWVQLQLFPPPDPVPVPHRPRLGRRRRPRAARGELSTLLPFPDLAWR